MLGTRAVKKFTLASLFLVSISLVAFWCIAQGGPEPVLEKNKEVMQLAPLPASDFFRASEWDLSIWGTFVFSANPGRNNIPNDDPFTPDLDPEIKTAAGIGSTILEPQSTNPNERVNLGESTKDTFLAKDSSWGGGVDLKYFWSRYFGVGVEGFAVDTETQIGGAGLVTLTGRYPIGRFAPYIWVGAGALAGGGQVDRFFYETHTYSGGFVTGETETFRDEKINNTDVFFDGQVGVGVEVRLTCHIGLMADFAWNFVMSPDNGNRSEVITSPGGTNFDPPNTLGTTFPNNTAINFVPGASADNKDFGMVRFGLTISY
jgi:hypothetical protein